MCACVCVRRGEKCQLITEKCQFDSEKCQFVCVCDAVESGARCGFLLTFMNPQVSYTHTRPPVRYAAYSLHTHTPPSL